MLLRELREFIRQELVSLLEAYVPRHGLEVVDYRQLMSDEVAAGEEKRDAEIEAMRVERERREGRALTPGEIRGLEAQWDQKYQKSMPTIVQKLKELEPRYRQDAERRSQEVARVSGKVPPDADTVVVPFSGQTFGLERFFVPSNKPEGPKFVMVSRLVKLKNSDGFVMAKDPTGTWRWHWAPRGLGMLGAAGVEAPKHGEGEKSLRVPPPAAARRGEKVQTARDAVAPPVIRRRRDEETGEVTGMTPVRTTGRRPVPPREIIDEPTGYVVGHKDASGRIVRPDNWAEIQRKIRDQKY